VDTDGGRIVMPGTPEPDQFDNERCGQVALVEIQGPGQVPKVRPLPVATLTWRVLTFDFLAEEASRATLAHELTGLTPTAANTVLRIILTGTASPKRLAEIHNWLEAALAPFLVGQIADRTTIALTPAELQDLRSRHPILAQVLADIDQLEILSTGRTPLVPASEGTEPLSLSEAQGLLARAKIELSNLTAEHLAQTRTILIQTMQEVAS
jgi:hypothetical protein